MKKETISRTTVCYWSPQDDCFVVESPFFPRIAGTGNTQNNAFAMFQRMLDEAYKELEHGNVHGYNSAGRPSKGLVRIDATVRPGTRESLDAIAAELNITKGEVIDLAIFFYMMRRAHPPVKSPPLDMAALEHRISEAVRQVIYTPCEPSPPGKEAKKMPGQRKRAT